MVIFIQSVYILFCLLHKVARASQFFILFLYILVRLSIRDHKWLLKQQNMQNYIMELN
jgi:hypothetical protein